MRSVRGHRPAQQLGNNQKINKLVFEHTTYEADQKKITDQLKSLNSPPVGI